MKFSKDIKTADKIFHDASRILQFHLLNPINASSVTRQVLLGKVKNPVFKYADPHIDLLKMRREVSSIKFEDKEIIETVMQEKQMDMIHKIDLLSLVGCFDFTQVSKKAYPLPDRKLVNKAYEIVQEKLPQVKQKNTYVPDKKVRQLFKKNFDHLGFKYKIKRADLVNSASVSGPHQEIVLKKNQRYTKAFLNRLIVHEVGTHLFRYENAIKHPLKVFGHGVANYITTEEGLAAYNEMRFGLLTQLRLKNYAGRVIAVHVAQTSSFDKTYRELKRFFPDKEALSLTMRAKRGLSHTQCEGGFTKDAVYLKGYYEVTNYMKKGGTLEDLYVGKISLKETPYLKQLGFKKPQFMPKKFFLFNDKLEFEERTPELRELNSNI